MFHCCVFFFLFLIVLFHFQNFTILSIKFMYFIFQPIFIVHSETNKEGYKKKTLNSKKKYSFRSIPLTFQYGFVSLSIAKARKIENWTNKIAITGEKYRNSYNFKLIQQRLKILSARCNRILHLTVWRLYHFIHLYIAQMQHNRCCCYWPFNWNGVHVQSFTSSIFCVCLS